MGNAWRHAVALDSFFAAPDLSAVPGVWPDDHNKPEHPIVKVDWYLIYAHDTPEWFSKARDADAYWRWLDRQEKPRLKRTKEDWRDHRKVGFTGRAAFRVGKEKAKQLQAEKAAAAMELSDAIQRFHISHNIIPSLNWLTPENA